MVGFNNQFELTCGCCVLSKCWPCVCVCSHVMQCERTPAHNQDITRRWEGGRDPTDDPSHTYPIRIFFIMDIPPSSIAMSPSSWGTALIACRPRVAFPKHAGGTSMACVDVWRREDILTNRSIFPTELVILNVSWVRQHWTHQQMSSVSCVYSTYSLPWLHISIVGWYIATNNMER